MSLPGDRPSAEEREARRAVLVDALRALTDAESLDREPAAAGVMRALDGYLEVAPAQNSELARAARSRLQGALRDLPEADVQAPERLVVELDGYLASAQAIPREEPVVDFSRLPGREIHWARYIAITVVAIVLSAAVVTWTSGWVLGGLVVLIWIVALIAITSS